MHETRYINLRLYLFFTFSKSRVFGVGGSNGAISDLIKSKMASGGHLGMTVLSRVSLASAGAFLFMFRHEFSEVP